MTDDPYRSQQPHPDWSARGADGSPAWGTPTHGHDPQHTDWSYDRGAAQGWSQYPPQQQEAQYLPHPPSAAAPQGSGAGGGRRRTWYVAAGAALVAAAATAFGFVATGDTTSTVNGSGSLFSPTQGSGGTSQGSGTTPGGSGGSGSGSGGTTPGGGSATTPGSGSGSGSSTSASIATAKQQVGVVTITSVLKYQNAESAGTGMILSADGEILTNNHVISGATSITVTVETTGKSYRADVVGTDASDDVAVVKLRDASGLTKAAIGDSGDVAAGDAIVGVGNAGGTGTLRAAAGKVTGLDKTITASDGNGSAGERLTGLIEVNAAIISGDSGGPLYDADGDIVGMDTAASRSTSQSQSTTAAAQAYAIPINSAVSIAQRIESGVTTSKIVQGVPGFLGVGVADAQSGGASITSVLSGGPAADAGITSGSVITSVGGKRTRSATALKTVMSGVKPGSTVRVTWTATDGSSHTANVTPIKGPAA